MTGIVTDEAGTPVPGATVRVVTDLNDHYSTQPSAVTNGSGAYKVDFKGVPGWSHYPALDPPGTREAVAVAEVEASGYEGYARYVLGTGQHLIENIRIRRIQRITAGESIQLTVEPDATVYAIDAWPGRELICGIVRVVPPRNGVMRVEAVPVQPGAALSMLRVHGGGTGAPRGNPTSIEVTAGTEYTVSVAIPWGLTASQSFLVTTSM